MDQNKKGKKTVYKSLDIFIQEQKEKNKENISPEELRKQLTIEKRNLKRLEKKRNAKQEELEGGRSSLGARREWEKAKAELDAIQITANQKDAELQRLQIQKIPLETALPQAIALCTQLTQAQKAYDDSRVQLAQARETLADSRKRAEETQRAWVAALYLLHIEQEMIFYEKIF